MHPVAFVLKNIFFHTTVGGKSTFAGVVTLGSVAASTILILFAVLILNSFTAAYEVNLPLLQSSADIRYLDEVLMFSQRNLRLGCGTN